MAYNILYHRQVESDDIPVLPDSIKIRIKNAIEERLVTHPSLYGRPLRKGLSGLRKLRIGDWRIVYRVMRNDVRILIIAHRSKVYQTVSHRV